MDQGKARFAFDQADNRLFVVLSDDGIRLPVAYPAALFDDFGALFNRKPVGNTAAPVLFAVPLSTQLLTTQVFP